MATPYVVQSSPLSRSCGTNTQDFGTRECFAEGLRQYCRGHNDHRVHDNPMNRTILENGQCQYPFSNWCSVCDNRAKPVYLGRRRCRSESTDIDKNNFGHRVTQEDCDKSFRTVREYNLRSGTNYHERFRNKISRKEYFASDTDTNKQVYGAYPLFDELKQPSKQHSLKNGSCRQLLGSCENRVELDRNVYFAKKCIQDDKCSSELWPKTATSDMSVGDRYNKKKQDDRYMQEMEMLRSKLRELKEGAHDGKRIRQRSESDYSNVAFGQDVGTKRPRDNSPRIQQHSSPLPRSPSPPPEDLQGSPMEEQFSSTDAEVDPSMLIPRIPVSNIPGSEEATSVSSDSEFADSACDDDEEEIKEEPESDNEELLKNPPVGEVCGDSRSPSHVVGDTLGSISLNDKVKKAALANTLNKAEGIHPGLRPSLFSHVPPYIHFFHYHEDKGVVYPPQVQALFKWRMSKITPVVVRHIILNSGFRFVRRSNEWIGTWGKHMKSICFKAIRDFQKINHFPGSFQIGRKDNLWRNLFRMMNKFGKKEFGFMPRTYILPQDNKLLRSAWEKHYGRERWIVKPPASARGSGIRVIYKWAQIPKKIPLVVQRYISDPFLINGSKFDLRLYALVTCVNPLRVYLYDNGLVRFASVKYSSDLSTLVDRYMHLTNYSINKLSSQYTQNEDAGACQGHKWTLKALWTYLEKEKGVNVEKLWAHMVDLVNKTMISGEASMTHLCHAHLASRYCTYELFGVDILLDQALKPWLLEVNISPSLHSQTPLDTAVKAPMVRDIMNMAGYQLPNKLSSTQQTYFSSSLGVPETLCFDKRLYSMYLSPKERLKQAEFLAVETRDEYLNAILEDLTPDDVRHLIQYEDELTQKGNFLKTFPTHDTHKYLQFFDEPRYYNLLFDAWETQFHKDRRKGIRILQNLCKKQVHLEVCAQVNRTKVSTSLTEQTKATDEVEVAKEEEEKQAVELDQQEPIVPPDNLQAKGEQQKQQQWTLSATALCRAARSRSGKPGVVTKLYARSSYITRRSLQSNQEKTALKTKS